MAKLLEHDIARKWGENKETKASVGLSQIFKLCRDIVKYRGNGDSTQVRAPINFDYEYILLDPQLNQKGKIKSILICALAKTEELSEGPDSGENEDYQVINSLLIEKSKNKKGKQRFTIYSPLPSFHAYLLESDLVTDTMICLPLEKKLRSLLFRNIRASFWNSVLNEQNPN